MSEQDGAAPERPRSTTRADRGRRFPMLSHEVSDGAYLDVWCPAPLVAENTFLTMQADVAQPPTYAEAEPLLPALVWPARPDLERLWTATWQLMFDHYRAPRPGTGLVAPFVDTAFNDCVFLWDSVFIAAFGRYARAAVPVQRTLDSLYAAQHPDGFITRELKQWDGGDRFHRHDPASTGPNLLAWSEWDHFEATGDVDRLGAVWPVIAAYHAWHREHRSWQDGSLWSTGFGCGMDNQRREPGGPPTVVRHGGLSWVDATAQQLLSADRLLRAAAVLGRDDAHVHGLREDAVVLKRALDRLWDPARATYCDRLPGGASTGVKSIAGYWALLTNGVLPERVGAMVAALEDPAQFGRPVPVPALSYDEPDYRADGDYWNGGVWSPTTYAVLRGLSDVGRHDVAHRLAVKHVDAVAAVHAATGTLWENYAPEQPQPGTPAKPDFVGWTGLSPVAFVLEFVLGLRSSPGRLEWRPKVADAVQMQRYPVGDELVDLAISAVADGASREVTVTTPVPLSLTLHHAGTVSSVDLLPGTSTHQLPPSKPL